MDHYHPPTKLREGDVFTGVCLSVGGSISGFQADGVHPTAGLSMMKLTIRLIQLLVNSELTNVH